MKTSDNVDQEILTYDFKPELQRGSATSRLCQSWNWPKRTGGGGAAAEMLEILPRDSNLKPIFTQKWASVDMNWEFNPNPPDNSNPGLCTHVQTTNEPHYSQ